MSVIFSTQDKYVNMDRDAFSEEVITPTASSSSASPPPSPSATVKKSTMYIIVALSVVVTSMMFAVTVTIVYHIAKEGNTSSNGGNAASSRGGTDNVSSGSQAHVQATTQRPDKGTSNDKRSVTYFTRWGRYNCTRTSDLLYAGYTAGSRYNQIGGTSNILCLPKQPQYKASFPGRSRSYLYGSEYNARGTNLAAVFGKDLNEHDIPCAVCEVTGSSAMMMVPARTECYRDWDKQYSGYLMTSNSAHNKSMDIVCMDENPESISKSEANNNGALFYFVEASGQLPSPPYSRDTEITCVVCTK